LRAAAQRESHMCDVTVLGQTAKREAIRENQEVVLLYAQKVVVVPGAVW